MVKSVDPDGSSAPAGPHEVDDDDGGDGGGDDAGEHPTRQAGLPANGVGEQAPLSPGDEPSGGRGSA